MGDSISVSVGEENEVFFIRVCKPLPSKRVLKTLRGISRRTGELGLLQRVSESDTGQCASKEAKA